MRHYCTLGDTKFLPQILALYESICRHSSEPFRLHVLAMDEESIQACRQSLNTEASAGIILDELDKFERYKKTLVITKQSRTWQEYCWTCASNYAHQILSWGWPEITYLDADCFFFSDPEAVFAEIGDKSIGIIPHRFPAHRKHMEVNGKFNVSWVTFRGPVGFKCLETWARQCRERCSAKEGCGDQCYLDTWSSDYPGEVCEIHNIGVGAAPWNLGQYKVTGDGHRVYLDGHELIMYHFHEYLHGKRLTNYPLRAEDKELIYKPYVEAIDEAQRREHCVRIAKQLDKCAAILRKASLTAGSERG